MTWVQFVPTILVCKSYVRRQTAFFPHSDAGFGNLAVACRVITWASRIDSTYLSYITSGPGPFTQQDPALSNNAIQYNYKCGPTTSMARSKLRGWNASDLLNRLHPTDETYTDSTISFPTPTPPPVKHPTAIHCGGAKLRGLGCNSFWCCLALYIQGRRWRSAIVSRSTIESSGRGKNEARVVYSATSW